MVRLASTSLTGLIALSQLATAAPQRNVGASDPETCIAGGNMYRSGRTYNMNNANYMVRCARDSEGDAASVQKVSRGGFAACFDACEQARSCAGFTYSGGREAGNCYLKNKIGGYSPAGDDLVSCHKNPDEHGEKPEPAPAWSSSTQAPPPPPHPATSSTSPKTSSSTYQVPPHPPASSSSSSKTSSSTYQAPPPASSSTSSKTSSSTYQAPSPASSSTSVKTWSSTYQAPPPPASSSTSTKIWSSTYQAPPPASSSTSTQTYISSTPTSSPAPIALNECQQAVQKYGSVYRGGNGSAYQLSCGSDHYGGDLSNAGSASFLGCVDVCDKNPDCIGYSYVPGICYLKSAYTAGQANPGVDFALNLERNATAKPSVTTSSSSTSPTSKPTPQPGSCGYLTANGTSNYYNSDGIRYTVECGSDHNGGDLTLIGASSFADCSVFCDKTTSCIAFAWVGGNGPGICYLKSSITGRESGSNVDYAYKDSPTRLPLSSTSSSSSTSSTVSVPVKSSSSSSYVAPWPTWTSRPTWTESKSSSSSSSAPPLPPPTWTSRPTWTSSKTSASTNSTVSSPVKPTYPSTSSTSKTVSSGTTKTVTHTYTRPSYATSSTSSKSKTYKTKTWKSKTRHTKSQKTTTTTTTTSSSSSSSSSTSTDTPTSSKGRGGPRSSASPTSFSWIQSTTKTRNHVHNPTTKSQKTKTRTRSKKTSSTHTLSTSAKHGPTPSTSCTTLTPSVNSTSTVRTITSSTSKPHTQTNWVSSTANSSSTSTSPSKSKTLVSSTTKASITTSTSPPSSKTKTWVTKTAAPWTYTDEHTWATKTWKKSEVTTKPTRRDPKEKHPMHYPKGKPLEDTDSTETWVQERPTRTRINPLRTTKLPFGQRIMINDHQFCEKIRGTKPRYLQAKVYDGNPKFDGYWLQDPYSYNGYKAQLCDSKSDAAPMAFNAESKVITTWRDRPGCAFIGLRLYAGNLHEMHSDTWLGEAGFGNGTAEYATGHMDITPQKEFVWQHEYFEHWLVCDHFEGVPVLKYKSNYHPWDYDRRRCGRVKLFWME